MTRLSHMSEEGIQFLVGVEYAVLGQIGGRLDGTDALAPRLSIECFRATVGGHRYVVCPVRRHRHLRYQSVQYRIMPHASDSSRSTGSAAG